MCAPALAAALMLALPAQAVSVECLDAAKRVVVILNQVAATNGMRLNTPTDDATFAAMMFETAKHMEAKGTCWMPNSMLRHLIANALNGEDS